MRIRPLNHGPYRAEGPANTGSGKQAGRKVSSRIDSACRVTCSERARLAHDVLRAAQAHSAFRADKVESLRRQLASGQFQTHGSSLAERIVAGLLG